MKKLFFLLIAIAMIACTSDEPKAFVIKPTDMVSIRPAAGTVMKVKSNRTEEHLTALEIVKQAHHFNCFYDGKIAEYNFSGKDSISEIPKLMFWAQYVISVDGNASLQHDILSGTDLVLLKQSGSYPNYINDTIAYIPNLVLRAAETEIREAYDNKDIDACYQIFNDFYTFTPITGAEWRALKKNNLQ